MPSEEKHKGATGFQEGKTEKQHDGDKPDRKALNFCICCMRKPQANDEHPAINTKIKYEADEERCAQFD